MPCRAPAHYTQLAVESILAQTYRHWHMVIVDDDAPAETKEYLYSLKEKRIEIIKHDRPAGLAASLNEGLNALQTDIVLRMDADDISLPQRFELQKSYLNAHPDVSVLGAQLHFINPDGHSIAKKVKVPLSHDEIGYRLLWSNAMNHPTVAYRRKDILVSGGYNAAFNTCEDYELWTRMILAFRFINLPSALLRYRLHPQQSTQTDTALKGKVHTARLAYRSRLTSLAPIDCDESCISISGAPRLEFYRLLASRFKLPKFQEDLARRLRREIQGGAFSSADELRRARSLLSGLSLFQSMAYALCHRRRA
jgi:glycosyltransferase involved in cell wall biosynthesis